MLHPRLRSNCELFFHRRDPKVTHNTEDVGLCRPGLGFVPECKCWSIVGYAGNAETMVCQGTFWGSSCCDLRNQCTSSRLNTYPDCLAPALCNCGTCNSPNCPSTWHRGTWTWEDDWGTCRELDLSRVALPSTSHSPHRTDLHHTTPELLQMQHRLQNCKIIILWSLLISRIYGNYGIESSNHTIIIIKVVRTKSTRLRFCVSAFQGTRSNWSSAQQLYTISRRRSFRKLPLNNH